MEQPNQSVAFDTHASPLTLELSEQEDGTLHLRLDSGTARPRSYVIRDVRDLEHVLGGRAPSEVELNLDVRLGVGIRLLRRLKSQWPDTELRANIPCRLGTRVFAVSLCATGMQLHPFL